MRTFISFSLVLAFCLSLTAVMAQSGQKSVTLKITKEINGQRTVIDTAFTVDDESEIDVILDQMGVSQPQPNQSIEKEIVIREIDGRDNDHQGSWTVRRKPLLGVYIGSHDGDGVMISSVSSRGGARDAGIRGGDIITEVAGEEVDRGHEIGEALEDHEPGDEVEVVYIRDGRVNSTTVKLKAGGIVHNERYNYNYDYDYDYDYDDDDGRSASNRPFLGIYPAMVSRGVAERNNLEDEGGIYVSNIVRDAGAEAAGLASGDVITHLNGERVHRPGDLTQVLNDLNVGDPLDITYVRDGQIKSTTAKLGKRKAKVKAHAKAHVGRMKETKKAFLGVYLEDEDDGGVRITKVSSNTAAESAGLEKGDVIMQLGDHPTDTYRDLSKAMKTFEPGETIRVKYQRNGKNRQTRATLGSKTVSVWVSDSDFDEDVDIDIIIRQFDNPAEGRALREFMESPSLNLEDFNYFPNPNDGKFRLQFDLQNAGDMQVRVYSPSGRLVYEEFKQDFSGEYDEEIDISDFVSEGVYFLQVSQNGKGIADKIIIR